MGNTVVQTLSFEELDVVAHGRTAPELLVGTLLEPGADPIRVHLNLSEKGAVHIELGHLLQFELQHSDSKSLCALIRTPDNDGETHLAPVKFLTGALLPEGSPEFHGNMEVTVHGIKGLKFFKYNVCGYLHTHSANVGPFTIKFALDMRSRILLAAAMGVPASSLTCASDTHAGSPDAGKPAPRADSSKHATPHSSPGGSLLAPPLTSPSFPAVFSHAVARAPVHAPAPAPAPAPTPAVAQSAVPPVSATPIAE